MTLTGAEENELPNINQPVLLEVQAIRVDDNVVAKVIWDNGSSGFLFTHYCAKRIGAIWESVSSWLDFVGNPRILRCITLYAFSLVDKNLWY